MGSLLRLFLFSCRYQVPGIVLYYRITVRGFYLKMFEVHRKVLLHEGALGLGRAGGGADEVLRVVVVVHPLEPRGAEGGQQGRHYQEVSRLSSDQVTELEEELLEGVIHHPETRGSSSSPHGHV